MLELPEFSSYLNTTLNQETTLIEQMRNGKIKLEILASNVQIGVSTVASITLSKNQRTTTTIEFEDGTKLIMYIEVVNKIGGGYQLMVEVTSTGQDRDGNELPKTKTRLGAYSNGDGGFNKQAFTNYFAGKGITVIYSSGSLSGGKDCETRWVCSNDGKTCVLTYIGGSC